LGRKLADPFLLRGAGELLQPAMELVCETHAEAAEAVSDHRLEVVALCRPCHFIVVSVVGLAVPPKNYGSHANFLTLG
jgi:hypothetical protein